jgi:hypothetical protein
MPIYLKSQLLKRGRQEDHQFKSSLGKVNRPYLEKKKKTKKHGWACTAILISTSKNPCSFLLLLILSLQQN